MVKLFVDSRKRAAGVSDTDFTYQAPVSIQLQQQICYVDTCLIPNVFYTIRAGENDKLYVREDFDDGVNPVVITYRIVTLPAGIYDADTLATAVALALNTGTTLTDVSPAYAVAYSATTGKLGFTTTTGNTGGFQLYPEQLLPTQWNIDSAQSVVSPQSANKVVGLLGDTVVAGSAASGTVYADSVVDCLAYHQLFLHANIGVPGQSYGPNGEGTIVRRIVVNAPQNSLIVDRFTTAWDHVRVGARTVGNISFRLADVNGRTVSTNGHHISFSIIFE